MSTASNLGRIAWYQLVTTDPDSAQHFYSKVVGWDTGDASPEPPSSDAGSAWEQLSETSALVTMDADGSLPPHWRAYVTVPDIEAACERALLGGGEVYLEATEIDGVGKIAVLGDILGAIFAVVEPCEALHDYPEGAISDGNFCWSELGTENYQLAFRFYESVFSWSPGRAVNVPNGRMYQMFKHGQREIGGILDLKRDEDVPPHWMHYIRVASVDDAVEAAKTHGGSVIIGAHTVPDGARTACLADPQGAIFSVWSPARPSAEKEEINQGIDMMTGLVDITGPQGRVIAAAMREVAEVDGIHEAEADLIRRFEEGLDSHVEEGASVLSVIDTDPLRTAYAKSMILVAYADGKLTDQERGLVEKKATEVGVSSAELAHLYTEVARGLLGAFSGVEIYRDQAVEIGRSLGLSDEDIDQVLR